MWAKFGDFFFPFYLYFVCNQVISWLLVIWSKQIYLLCMKYECLFFTRDYFFKFCLRELILTYTNLWKVKNYCLQWALIRWGVTGGGQALWRRWSAESPIAREGVIWFLKQWLQYIFTKWKLIQWGYWLFLRLITEWLPQNNGSIVIPSASQHSLKVLRFQ